MYAIIIDGTVVEVREFPALLPGESAVIMPCGAEVQKGWVIEAGTLVPPEPEADPNAGIDAQILALEDTVTPRRLRDAALTEAGKAWLAEVEAQIVALRSQRV